MVNVEVKFLATEEELKEIEKYANMIKKTQSEFILTAIQNKIERIKSKNIRRGILKDLVKNVPLAKISEKELNLQRKKELESELNMINEALEKIKMGEKDEI